MRSSALSLSSVLLGLVALATTACGGANNPLTNPDSGGSMSPTGDSGTSNEDAGGNGSTTCGTAVACGTAGATYEECTTLSATGECSAIVYNVSSGRAFTCTGCTSCGGTQQDLASYCSANPMADSGAGDGGHSDGGMIVDGSTESGTDAGDGGSSDGSLGDASLGDGGTQCLVAVPCGTGGLTYQECTATTSAGACVSIQYNVSNGTSYTCASCGDCTAAVSSLDTFCADQGTPVTSCSAWSACESSPLNEEICTTSLNGTCQGMYYETSDGQQFACASCNNCTTASTNLDNYCNEQTTPVTTCGASSPCGVGGATYAQCSSMQGTLCDSSSYTVSDGESFTCASCTECAAALSSVESYCASLTSTGSLVMFGGMASDNVTTLGDSWIWNGAWTAGPATGPAARFDSSGAVLGGQFVLFGGTTVSVASVYGDTWAWGGTGWTELATTGPAARFGSGTAAIGGQMMLFSGATADAVTSIVADTWLWNGASWSSLNVTGPTGRAGGTAASINGQVVFFGGIDATGAFPTDTWVFDGSAWTQLTPATSPPGRYYASMATLDNQVLLFGGNDGADLGDTWVWDGANWTQMMVTGPSARNGGAVAAWNGGILLFGGCSGEADTWIWNGAAWTSSTATGPQARCSAVMGGL